MFYDVPHQIGFKNSAHVTLKLGNKKNASFSHLVNVIMKYRKKSERRTVLVARFIAATKKVDTCF